MLLIVAMSALLVLAGASAAQAQEGSNGAGEGFESAESHCALGGIGFLLVLTTLGAGFLVSGRFGRIAGFRPLPIHKLVVVGMTAYLTGEFIYGSMVRGVLFTYSMHGVLGFSVVALSWLTAGLNPLWLGRVVKWKWASKIHLVLAAGVFIFLVAHLAYAFSVFGE